MRILLATSSLASHHHAMVPFGWAALAAGHEVRLATSPELVTAAARSGLPVVAVGPELDFPQLHRDLLERVRREGLGYDPKLIYCEVAELMADGLVALARQWRPDVVVWDPATLAAPVAAAVVGARAVRYLWGLDIMGRGATLVERLPASYGRVYERFGQELPADPDWWTFDPSPPSVWPVTTGTRRAVRYVPYSPHNEPPPSVYGSGDRPRALLTFGAGIAMKEFVAVDGFASSPVMRGVTALDVDIVVAAAPSDVPALGELPPGVEVVTGCPLSALLPSCSVVVHHAGNGTLLTAGLAGVPQIVVSHLPESVFSARQFEPTGAVRHLPAGEVTAELIRDSVARALADAEWRRAADALRAEMLAQPVPGELLAELAAA